ncbi:uncharacterized protein UTRI_00197_B [Ustilago trichophora]|uniref:Uncharacterized protein n=1 Tax=Ustilago trichophora TaxID=86804 RepID=A0A5C3DNR2_9BASI|nr:uncharacterized protein UTRI_00197_B [Ustilago trichophora]
MSELFDSLNLSNSAGPSSSQQSSSQPSTSKVFWHASPSPGVLRQLQTWTPSKSQDSPTLPLCTQAFVGELKKLPGALEAQSPLVARGESVKRKLNANSRHVSDPTANRGKAREYITLELSDDEDDEEQGPRRLLLGDVGESSPESRRRRTMDAGHTGRVRQPSSPSELSSVTARTILAPPMEKDPQHTASSSHRRMDRRPPRRRKKESFMAGLGFTDDSGRATDCLKLFEDLQAAIQGMHASRPSTSGSMESASTPSDHRPTVTFDRGSSEGGRLTPREGINRTTSAPSATRNALSRQDTAPRFSQHGEREESLQPRRIFRPVKSDHDVFRAGGVDLRALQPRPTNVPTEPQTELQKEVVKAPVARVHSATSSQHSQGDHHSSQQPQEATKPTSPPIETSIALLQEETSVTRLNTTAAPSPVKRSARIEAMQQQQQQNHTATKKLGTRGPSSLLSRSSPRKLVASSTGSHTPLRTTRAISRPSGMSQARQPGLPRSCSQYLPVSQQPSQSTGPAAPFRPPAIARGVNIVRTATSPVKNRTGVAKGFKNGQPSSSDDSFGDDDDAFLALACELEY